MTALQTPFYNYHNEFNAVMTDFGDWKMPARYGSVLAEHRWVRESAGLFDVSHMGEIKVTGPEATEFLQLVASNDVHRLQDGDGQYSLLLNHDGGIIDDFILYRLRSDEYLLCVNASNTLKDYSWIKGISERYDVVVSDQSTEYCQLALQGPKSKKVLDLFCDYHGLAPIELAYTKCCQIMLEDSEILIARTGYTGEHGYELYAPPKISQLLWTSFFECSDFLKPIGLGARDTLRLEAGYLLYGNDISDQNNPIELGVGWAVKTTTQCIGYEAVERIKAQGSKQKLVAFLMEEGGIPRHGMEIFNSEKPIGRVTSGSMLPSVDRAGGLALVDRDEAGEGNSIYVDIRGKRKLATIARKPLYSANVK